MSAIQTNFCPFPGFLFSFAFPMFLELMKDPKKDFYKHKQIKIDYGRGFEGILAFLGSLFWFVMFIKRKKVPKSNFYKQTKKDS